MNFIKFGCQMSHFFRKTGRNTNFFNIATNLIFFSVKKRVVFKVKQTQIEVAIVGVLESSRS